MMQGWAPSSISPHSRQSLFTGGKWHSARDGAVLEVLNPADGNRLATVSGGPADVDEAIEAAWSAFGQWSSLSAKIERRLGPPGRPRRGTC